MKTKRNLTQFCLLAVGLLALPSAVQAQFTFTTNNGTITITGYTGTNSVVNIPSSTNGLSVTSIGTYAFYENISLTNIAFPDSITTIGAYAFDYTGLTSLTIPANVTNIGAGAFAACYNLTAINVATNNPIYTNVGGVLYNQSLTLLLQYPAGNSASSYSIPNSVTSIGGSAFDYTYRWLTSITIPASVTNIGQEAFFQGGLTSIIIPSSVTSIGSYAFAYCYNLNAVHFMGNAPSADSTLFIDLDQYPNIIGYEGATAYYLPGTSGWTSSFGGVSTALWKLPYPVVLTRANGNPNFGVSTNRFGFEVSWATNTPVVVEASTNLTNPTWIPLQTNTLTNGSFYFSDSQWTNSSHRYYRVQSP